MKSLSVLINEEATLLQRGVLPVSFTNKSCDVCFSDRMTVVMMMIMTASHRLYLIHRETDHLS